MTDAAVTYEKGKLYDIPISDLKTDTNQPRKFLDPQALDELAASIAQHGVLEPILFRVENGGIGGHDPTSAHPEPVEGQISQIASPATLFIVAGERRFEAAKKAGLTTIPAIFIADNYAEIALVENLLRQDLTAVEEAEALQSLLTEQSYTHEQLAGIIGKARVTITEILTLNRLPREIRDECRSSSATARSTLLEIARKKQDRAMVTAWNAYKAKLARQAAGRTRQAKAAQSPEDVIAWLGKTADTLEGIETSAWTEDQQNTFSQTLMNLQEAIQAILNPVGPDNLA